MQYSTQFKLIFIGLLLISFAAKLYTGHHLRHTFLERGNSKTYLNAIAYNLVLNSEYSIKKGIPSVDYEPLFPFMMSIAYSISGPNWLALTIMQALLHLLTSFLIYKIASSLWSETSGMIAGAFHSFYPYLFTYSLSIYDTTLFVFLLVAIVYFTLIKNKNYAHFVIAGVLFGLAFLTRATILTFIPPLFLFLAYTITKRESFFMAVTKISVLILAMIVTMGPWLTRNHQLTGRYLISTHGPFGLWQGNNEYSGEYLSKNISLDNIYRLQPPLAIYAKYPLEPRFPKEAVIAADAYQQEAMGWIRSHPSDFPHLAFLKAQKLWTWNRNPSSSNPKFGTNEGRQSVNLISYLPLLIALPFGLVFLYKKNKAAALAIAGILLCFTGAHMIAMGFTRARIPVDFLLMICFGIAVDFAIEHYLKNKNRNLKTASL